MNTEILAAVIGGLFGLLGGSIASHISLKLKRMDQDIENQKLWVSTYDKILIEKRMIEYPKLWKLTEPTSRRNMAKMTEASAGVLLTDLTSWYYGSGGILLSEPLRDMFFAARNALDGYIEDKNQQSKSVVNAFSTLRTMITQDMATRRLPANPEGSAK